MMQLGLMAAKRNYLPDVAVPGADPRMLLEEYNIRVSGFKNYPVIYEPSDPNRFLSLTHSLTYSLTHLLTHSLTHSLTLPSLFCHY